MCDLKDCCDVSRSRLQSDESLQSYRLTDRTLHRKFAFSLSPLTSDDGSAMRAAIPIVPVVPRMAPPRVQRVRGTAVLAAFSVEDQKQMVNEWLKFWEVLGDAKAEGVAKV